MNVHPRCGLFNEKEIVFLVARLGNIDKILMAKIWILGEHF
jgi:hypothetical protein